MFEVVDIGRDYDRSLIGQKITAINGRPVVGGGAEIVGIMSAENPWRRKPPSSLRLQPAGVLWHAWVEHPGQQCDRAGICRSPARLDHAQVESEISMARRDQQPLIRSPSAPGTC